MHKYSPDVYEAAVKSFCSLPVTALVDGRFFCVHGGISPELNTLDDLKNVSFVIFFYILGSDETLSWIVSGSRGVMVSFATSCGQTRYRTLGTSRIHSRMGSFTHLEPRSSTTRCVAARFSTRKPFEAGTEEHGSNASPQV
jgi:diadenosine tetraphosphatase ApaH/serine/threonine PP2A family protein phosphatase